MWPFRRIGLATLTALLTLGGVVAILVARGHEMFSPGPLARHQRAGTPHGDVSSHADLATNCAACHVTPGNTATMAGRCLDCHSDVRRQIEKRGPLHGRMA